MGSKEVESALVDIIEHEKPIIMRIFQPQSRRREFCVMFWLVTIRMTDEIENLTSPWFNLSTLVAEIQNIYEYRP
jgi:hypothetical protein